MATPSNVYLTYKRDIRYLLYWLIHTQNGILRSTAPEADETTTEINTTGQTTLADLVSMSELIAQHLESTPAIIYCLFQSIIKTRIRFHGVLQPLSATHRDFIVSFTKAFNALGGESWLLNQNDDSDRPERQSEKDIEEVVFATKALNLEQEEEDGASSEEMAQLPQQARQVRRKKSSKKSKKNKKKGKKSKKKQKTTSPEDELEGVPLESYKIIEGEEATATDYLMAAHAAAGEWVDLRAYCRDL